MELTRRDRATKSPLAPSRPSFTIALVARDIQLWDLCQECANAIETAHCKIIQHDPGQATDISADLLIWDVDSTPWPIGSQASTQSNQEQLFLIGRKQLREFLTDMPLGAGSTLLKPLSLRTLQIFLEQAVARWRDSFLADIDNSDDPQDSYAKDALQCLLMANLKLQEYDQDRTNFLARAVHDFRAPLMAASGYCSLLLEDAMGPLNGEQTDVVRRILHSVDKLTGMASAMLQLSAGKHVVRVPELKESNLPSCINNAVHELEPQALEKHIGISVNLLEPDRPLYFEQRQIERVVGTGST